MPLPYCRVQPIILIMRRVSEQVIIISFSILTDSRTVGYAKEKIEDPNKVEII
jgi:hypothetical protein